MPNRPTHPCEGLPASARKTFDAVAAGGEPGASRRTIALLLEHGLLERHSREHRFNDGLPPMLRYAYSVPLQHHIAWCEYWARPRVSAAKRKGRRKPTCKDQLTLF